MLDQPPSLIEVRKAIEQINNGKAPGMDGITAEILKSGGDSMEEMLHSVMSDAWDTGAPQDWKDAIMISIFKKGLSNECGNYCDISLLSIVGKVFARIPLTNFLNILQRTYCLNPSVGFEQIVER